MNDKRSVSISRSGFTLLELLVAIAIIAVLFVLALNVSKHLSATQKKIGCISNLRHLHAIFHNYARDNGNCFPVGHTSTAPRVWTNRIEPYLLTDTPPESCMGLPTAQAPPRFRLHKNPTASKRETAPGGSPTTTSIRM